jgi:hypothetical protein
VEVSVADKVGHYPRPTRPLLANAAGLNWFMFITMKDDMKQRYRAFLRPWGVYYCEDLVTGKQETLKTCDKNEAYRLVRLKMKPLPRPHSVCIWRASIGKPVIPPPPAAPGNV